MIQVQVDGRQLSIDTRSIRAMGELIELVKSTIDPDVMITSILFNNEALSDQDWNAPLVLHAGKTLQIQTGTKQSYLADRLGSAPDIISQVSGSFHQVADSYRIGYDGEGNQRLTAATNDLLALINWLGGLLMIDPERFVSEQEEFKQIVDGITAVCEDMLQQQLYAAWWPLADVISNRLIAKLDSMKAFAGRLAMTTQPLQVAAMAR